MICKICKKDYDKSNYKNKCINCYQKQYKIDNPNKKQKISKDYTKQYNIDNEEKIKQYYIDNRQKILNKQKKYRKDYPNKFLIKIWKYNGLIELEGVYSYQSLYEYYISITHCEVCNKKFKNSNDRCMDHCHTTNIFRWVLCRSCNSVDHWMTYFN
tara:strand:+ start:100 stop:567 length:468 start_codon:yes stop_codon:yes gene_type:complete